VDELRAKNKNGLELTVGPSAWNGLPSELRFLPRDLNFYFRSGLGMERLWVVTLKWRYINFIDI